MAAGTGPAAMEVPMTTLTHSSGPLVSGVSLGRKARRLAGAAAGGLALLALSLLLRRSPHDVLAALPGGPGRTDLGFGFGG